MSWCTDVTPQKTSRGLTELPIENLNQSWVMTRIMITFSCELCFGHLPFINAKICFTFSDVEYYRCLGYWDGAPLDVTSGSISSKLFCSSEPFQCTFSAFCFSSLLRFL